jgi:hypothetical protein
MLVDRDRNDPPSTAGRFRKSSPKTSARRRAQELAGGLATGSRETRGSASLYGRYRRTLTRRPRPKTDSLCRRRRSRRHGFDSPRPTMSFLGCRHSRSRTPDCSSRGLRVRSEASRRHKAGPRKPRGFMEHNHPFGPPARPALVLVTSPTPSVTRRHRVAPSSRPD